MILTGFFFNATYGDSKKQGLNEIRSLTSEMLVQLSYVSANWELVVVWVDYKPVDDGYRFI